MAAISFIIFEGDKFSGLISRKAPLHSAELQFIITVESNEIPDEQADRLKHFVSPR